MVIDHRESGTGATTCWYACSLCGTVRLTSEPGTGDERSNDLSASLRAAEDDSGYAGESPVSATELEA